MRTGSIIFCILLFYGCKKHPFDYRNKFLGDYAFTVSEHSSYPAPGHDTTYSRTGKVWYGSNKNSVLISFTEGGSTEFTLSKDGILDGGACDGEFESRNKVKYNCYYASPGAHTSQEVIGEKTK